MSGCYGGGFSNGGRKKWEWLTGGDLLVASGILFALIDVRYLTTGEGLDVRYFEFKKRNTQPGYFYYNKTTLVPAQSATTDYEYISRELDDDESGDEMMQRRLVRTPNRHVDSTMQWWLWDKAVSGTN